VKRAALGVFFLLMLLPASVWASSARHHSSVHFKLVRADAHVTLRFYRQNDTGTSIDRGRVVLHVKGKSGSGTAPGKLRFAAKGSVLEHVRLTRQDVGQQTTCEQKRKIVGNAALSFTQEGSKIRVRWMNPQARVSFCPGPPTNSLLTEKITKAISAKKLRAGRTTISILGHSSEKNRDLLQASYRWRMTFTLAKTS
jgi:hypothetical protein